ncbi:hypothetical protein A3F55_01990 [Candidatus Adlerbacteria bacterium RIFCSPHIGHO2_12_FULL_53_18]|uniref:Uncharacterized protein n=1 Tax=Candidatus Adlerbacteria bacterium RIFCSPHIGHO2_12_FULL_53_18 TaxID=1797242 RepID=A0A1F4XS18_9BACT|nr:MAG: hypothetical protein A3F55_01990 [Candidatus Adlerbacteria bacterium RIFCSPHIGHO2_12_FULL_53_18]
MDGYILEFGSGIAGYAIFVPTIRRRVLNIITTDPNGPKAPIPAQNWEAGDPVYVPGVGGGKVIQPGSSMSKVKIGDMVPCLIPTSHMQKPARRKSRFRASGPRSSRFNISEIDGSLRWL